MFKLPPTWVGPTELEDAIRPGGGPHAAEVFEVDIIVPPRCRVMVVAAIRLLSLCNQLALSSRRVRLDFQDADAAGYLNRIGFFDNLAPEVQVTPSRPAYSAASAYRGGNAGLVEIARVRRGQRDTSLPTRLSAAVAKACAQRPDVGEITGAVWTIFAELVDNVFSHSETPLDGYAALQVYSRGNNVALAVSDSGLGIMKTLRPALQAESPRLSAMTDTDILLEVFREGLSRHGADRGCGLKGSAAKAMKYRANLDVRLPGQRMLLRPSPGNRPVIARCHDNIPLLWGTHIGLELKLAA